MRRDYCREVFPFFPKILCRILQYKAIFKCREGEGREALKIRIILREVAKFGATAAWQDWGRRAETEFWCGIIWLKTVTITPSFTYCNECRHAARTVWEYLIHESMNMILGAFNCWIFGVSGSFFNNFHCYSFLRSSKGAPPLYRACWTCKCRKQLTCFYIPC